MPVTVYVVQSNGYNEDWVVEGVFSTEERANAFCAKEEAKNSCCRVVRSFVVDEV